jgi:anaerobic selenocysteine-containing dehydrogenase
VPQVSSQRSAVNKQHSLSRRQFLQATAASAVAGVVFTGCQPSRREFMAQSRVRLAEDVLSAYENWYATTCRQCNAGCGLIARVVEGRAKKLEGNPDHPVNRGKLCARGQAGVQEQYHPDRLQGPLRRRGPHGAGTFSPTTWDPALDELAARLRNLQQDGRGGQAVLLTPPLRGHHALLVERFTEAFGAQWLTFDPLAEIPFREAARRVLGSDSLPDLDLQNAHYVLSFGADFLNTWLSPVHYSVEYGIFRQGSYGVDSFQPRQGRPRGHLVQIEPRFSATAANADEWVPITPGREGLLALSLAQVIVSEGLADQAGAAAFGDAAALESYRPEQVAQESGVPAERIRQLARDFAARRPSLAFGGGPTLAHTNATETLSSILSLNLLVGSVGREGGLRPNPAPPIEGLSAASQTSRMTDWQQLADRLRADQVQIVLIYNANPLYGLPNGQEFRDALIQAPYIVSFSSFMDETTAQADIVLPAHLQLEDWGDDVPRPGPGFPVLTVQQPVLRPFYDTRSFWDVLLALGEEVGGPLQQALPWRTFKDLLREAAAQLQQLNRGSVQDPDFERFWVKLLQRGGWWDDGDAAAGRPGEGATAGQSATPATPSLPLPIPAPRFSGSEQEFPFHLIVFPHNTLGAGGGAHLPWLQAAPDPVTTVVWQTWVELNPKVAQEHGLAEGDVVAVESPHGRLEAPVYVSPAAPPNVLGMPLGQGHSQYGRWAERRGANPISLLAPLADEATGSLAYAATRVRLTKTARRLALPKFEGTVPAYQHPDHEVLEVTRE